MVRACGSVRALARGGVRIRAPGFIGLFNLKQCNSIGILVFVGQHGYMGPALSGNKGFNILGFGETISGESEEQANPRLEERGMSMTRRDEHCVGSASASVSQCTTCSRTAPPCSGCARRTDPTQSSSGQLTISGQLTMNGGVEFLR